MTEVQRRLDGRLGAAMVELTSTSATHQAQDAIEHPLTCLVSIQPKPQQMPQEARVLRDPGRHHLKIATRLGVVGSI